MLDEYFRLSASSIRSKGIRSWLTMIGIFVGIAAIVGLISLGEGLQNAINEQFEMLGGDLIYVTPGGSLFDVSAYGSSKLSEEELEIVQDIPGVNIAAGYVIAVSQLKYRDETSLAYIGGFPADDTQDLLFDGTGISIVKGQQRFREGDTRKIAIGYEFWSGNTFDRPIDVGERVVIEGHRFEVVAHVSRIGNPQDDSNIYMPLDDFRDLYDGDGYDTIMVRPRPNTDLEEVADRIKETLRKERGLEEGKEDFQVTTTEQVRESVDTIFSLVQWFLVFIAGISLFVGGLGIMNTMYTSVLERTREIGVMKAIGARNEDVLALFLVESGIIGLVGGTVGTLLGGSLGLIVGYFAEMANIPIRAHFPWWLIAGALLFSFVVGALSGVLPALQASKLHPVDALRCE